MAKDKLSAVTVKQAKPGDKPYKPTNGYGMYLLITPDGSKYWRRNLRFSGKQKTLALGVFPESNSERNIRILELNDFPWIGNRPVGQIEATELLVVLRRAHCSSCQTFSATMATELAVPFDAFYLDGLHFKISRQPDVRNLTR